MQSYRLKNKHQYILSWQSMSVVTDDTDDNSVVKVFKVGTGVWEIIFSGVVNEDWVAETISVEVVGSVVVHPTVVGDVETSVLESVTLIVVVDVVL